MWSTSNEEIFCHHEHSWYVNRTYSRLSRKVGEAHEMVTANVLRAAVASVRDACGANLINVEEADGDNDSDHIPKINEP